MKDGSQAAVRVCKCPPSAPARDMERDNIGGHTGHQGTTTSGGPQHPHLVLTLPFAHFFAIFAILSNMCAMQVYGGLPGMSGAPGPEHDTFVTIAETESGTKAWS